MSQRAHGCWLIGDPVDLRSVIHVPRPGVVVAAAVRAWVSSQVNACPRRHDPCPRVPDAPALGQREVAAHGAAAWKTSAGRVLGLLSPQLDTYPPLYECVARTLRARRVGGGGDPLSGLRARARAQGRRSGREAPRNRSPGAA